MTDNSGPWRDTFKEPHHRPGFEHLAPTPPYATSESGAMREAISEKIDTTLVPYELVLMAAVAFNYGAEKYTARNFEQGFTVAQLCGSIERHNKALMDGEFLDQESGIPHLALLAASVGMYCHNYMQGRLVHEARFPAKFGVSIDSLSRFAQELFSNRSRPDAQR